MKVVQSNFNIFLFILFKSSGRFIPKSCLSALEIQHHIYDNIFPYTPSLFQVCKKSHETEKNPSKNKKLQKKAVKKVTIDKVKNYLKTERRKYFATVFVLSVTLKIVMPTFCHLCFTLFLVFHNVGTREVITEINPV